MTIFWVVLRSESALPMSRVSLSPRTHTKEEEEKCPEKTSQYIPGRREKGPIFQLEIFGQGEEASKIPILTT